jgi:hypothetical protein
MLNSSVAADPEIAGTRHRVVGNRRNGVRFVVIDSEEKIVEFLRIETRQAEIEIRFLDFLQFQSE